MLTGAAELEAMGPGHHIHAAALAMDQCAARVTEGDALAMTAFATMALVHVQWAFLLLTFPPHTAPTTDPYRTRSDPDTTTEPRRAF